MTKNKIGNIELPPMELRFMNETDEQFIDIGLSNFSLLEISCFEDDSRILDLGCGYGRLAYALNMERPSFSGEYLGLDILDKHIAWCKKAFGKKRELFKFDSIDVKNDRYHVAGTISPSEYSLPVDENYFDYVSLFSVFTHMYEADILNYLNEINRVLKPGAICVATFFTYNDAVLAKVNNRGGGITLTHQLNEHTRYFNSEDPLHAIAFEHGYLLDTITRCGFSVESTISGHWAGGPSPHYQDVFVIKKGHDVYDPISIA